MASTDSGSGSLPQERTAGDYVHSAATAAAGSVPFFGAALAELFGLLVIAPLTKRREEWLTSLGERVLQLEEHGLNRETLAQDADFLTAVLEASEAAERTASREKREALRNAVTNVALATEHLNADMQAILLRLVRDLTPSHLQMLGVLHDPYRGLPGGPPQMMRTTTSAPPLGLSVSEGSMDLTQRLREALPDLPGVHDLLVDELQRLGLMRTQPDYRTVRIRYGSAAMGSQVQLLTDLGRRFVRFVENPLD